MSPDSPTSTSSSGKSENLVSQEKMIGSLGQALGGMSIGHSVVGKGFYDGSNQGSPPGALASASSQSDRELTWGSTFSSSASKSYSSAGAHGAVEDSGEPKTPIPEKNGYDLFLSQSPSQALGGDLLKRFSSSNLPALDIPGEDRYGTGTPAFRFGGNQSRAPGPAPASAIGDARPGQDARRRTESPACSVTGTTTSSRSASPYANNSVDAEGRRTIQAYQGYDNGGLIPGDFLGNHQATYEDNRANTLASMTGGYGSNPPTSSLEGAQRMHSPFARDTNTNQNRAVGFGSPFEPSSDIGSFNPVDQAVSNGSQQQQQQVLYMAVPTADGRGQVLQPVQMVQLPGKPFAYVVPGAAGMIGANTGVPGVGQGNLGGASQPMMVLPTLPPQTVNDRGGLMTGTGLHENDRQNKFNGFTDSGAAREDFSSLPRNDMNQFAPQLGNQTDAISSLYAAPQRPPLETLLGQVRRLSRDQVGCRLVQQALDEEGPMAATLILNEGLSFWGEAMVDPFGNYLFQKILEKITPDERIMLVKSVSTRLVNASLNLHGTRSVQKVVELCAADSDISDKKDGESAADILTRSLAPAAARLCIDSHGNHVIQRILLKLGHSHSKFVFDAVAASVSDVARHRHGCCVIQRCLDSPPSEARSHLVRRIVDKSLELMQDAYGNYVVQYVLDVCSDEDVQAVCESVVGKVNLLAIQKFSSNVMEKCLERCSDRVKEQYMQELGDEERIRELMMDPFGNYVVQRALSVATHAQAVRLVEAMRPHLIASQPGTPGGQRNGGMRNTAGGRRIMAKICRRFPNFTLTPMVPAEELYNQNKGMNRHHHQGASPMGNYARIPGGPSSHPQANAQHHVGMQHLQPYGDPNLQRQPLNQRQQFYELPGAGYYEPAVYGHGAYQNM